MSKITNWPTRAMYMVFALALVLGMAIMPATSAMAQEAPSIIKPDPSTIDYNVKGSIHKVVIDLGGYNVSEVKIDWWVEGGVVLTPDKVTVIDAGDVIPQAPWELTDLKKKDTDDSGITWVQFRAMTPGDIHIYVEITDRQGMPITQYPLHTEKKWGSLDYTDLDVDTGEPGLQHTTTIELPAPGATGNYTVTVEDAIYAKFLEVPGNVLVDGAIVHWWLLEEDEKGANQAWIDAFMDYIVTQEGAHREEPPTYWSASGKYKITDPFMDGKQPWKFINDWVRGVAPVGDPKYADTNVLAWNNLSFDPWAIADHPDTDVWYGWSTSEDGKAKGTFTVNMDNLPGDEVPEDLLVLVLVSYPGGSNPQEDPFNGENPICLEKGKIYWEREPYYKPPEITTVKTPQLRWAGEPIVLEHDWGVAPNVTIETIQYETGRGTFEALQIEGRFYAAVYNNEGESIGTVYPVVDMSGLTLTVDYEGPDGTMYGDAILLDFASMGLPTGGDQVIAPLGGGVYDLYISANGTQIEGDTEWWTSSISRAMLASEMSGQADVEAALYEVGFRITMVYVEGDGHLDIDLTEAWAIGPTAKQGFLVYFLKFEDIVIADETPPSSITDLEPQEEDAHVAVQVRGYFDYRHSHLPATIREARVIDVTGAGDYVVLPTGRYVFPDDWVLLAGTNDISLRPNFDLMDQPDDNITSDCRLGPFDEDVWTTDDPGEAEYPTIGPFSTLQRWTDEAMWAAWASVPGSTGLRNTVVPDGIIDRWDAPMPPALVMFNVVSDDGDLKELLKTDLYGYGYTGTTNAFHSPYYDVEIPASPYIPQGYVGWQSWGWDPEREVGDMVITMAGPYEFWTDLGMENRWREEDPLNPDPTDVWVYSDNHGIAGVAIDALPDEGYVTITATADFPYTPEAFKYGPAVSDEITATWGEYTPVPKPLNPHFVADKLEVEVGETVTFDNETTLGNPPYKQAQWDFDGDGYIDTDIVGTQAEVMVDVPWEYDAPGLYNVSLTMTDQLETRTETRWYYITVTGEGPGPTPDEPSPEDGLASIADELVMVYYYAGGGVWDVYWPDFGIDTIETLEVGKIYQIYVESNCTLTYGTHSYDLNGPDWNFVYWLGN